VAPGREILQAGRVVLGVAVALTALGLVISYSSSSARLAGIGKDVNAVLAKQACWAFLAAGACALFARVPLSALSRWARPLLFLVLGLLVVTLFFGKSVNGSRRWMEVLGARFQPSEMLKLAVLLFLARGLAEREEHTHFGQQVPVLGLLAPIVVGVGLVLVQPDLGSSLFVVAEAVVLLGLAGIRPARLAPLATVALPALVAIAWAKFPHVQRRWDLWTQGSAEVGGQVQESLVAIGSGGLTGRGLGQGTHKLFYVQESNTDFIAAVLGEELGFVGCAAVILGFLMIVWFGRKITLGARVLSPQASYLAGGATFVIAFQAAINLAVVTNSAPTKGIPLPFISVGGSNLVLVLCCVGILVNVARRAAAAAGDSGPA
jgi:cell division protein FtsW